jgi:hypothetical protein
MEENGDKVIAYSSSSFESLKKINQHGALTVSLELN